MMSIIHNNFKLALYLSSKLSIDEIKKILIKFIICYIYDLHLCNEIYNIDDNNIIYKYIILLSKREYKKEQIINKVISIVKNQENHELLNFDDNNKTELIKLKTAIAFNRINYIIIYYTYKLGIQINKFFKYINDYNLLIYLPYLIQKNEYNISNIEIPVIEKVDLMPSYIYVKHKNINIQKIIITKVNNINIPSGYEIITYEKAIRYKLAEYFKKMIEINYIPINFTVLNRQLYINSNTLNIKLLPYKFSENNINDVLKILLFKFIINSSNNIRNFGIYNDKLYSKNDIIKFSKRSKNLSSSNYLNKKIEEIDSDIKNKILNEFNKIPNIFINYSFINLKISLT